MARKPVVTEMKLVVFFERKFQLHSKIFVPTENTTDLYVKHFKHNVITTKPIKPPTQKSVHVRYVTFCFLPRTSYFS